MGWSITSGMPRRVKFEGRSSGNLEPLPFPLVSPASPVLQDVQAIDVLLC